MSARWQISAGEISEWLPPFLFALAAVASAWVLSDARRRNFASYAVAAWTLAALLSPPVVLPLYLLARTFKQKPDAPPQAEEAQDVSDENDVAAEVEENDAANEADESDGDAAFAPAETSTGAQAQTSAAPPEKTRAAFWRTYAALVYALALLSLGAIYFYRDYRSLDAHLARAANARLVGQRSTTIREYRAALRLAPDAHTQKLLAVELAADG
ncbi:MAG TPA: hypothetical protein VJT82_04055, partial [Pyrinomonadaceae bacterium]|nr:hypothetical protein [Pyrinomonadaceae bacterium]